MDFIAGRIERRQAQGQAGFRPSPGRGIRPGRLVQRAPEQEGQHRIFSQMGTLAGEHHKGMDRLIRQMRKEPAHERRDEARGVLEGHPVAGRGEDNQHPDQQWQPIFEERS